MHMQGEIVLDPQLEVKVLLSQVKSQDGAAYGT